MLKDELFRKIEPVFYELFDYNIDISLTTKFEWLNMDSIKFITLIVKSEELFNFEIDDENLIMNRYDTLGDYLEMIICQVNKG